MHGIFNVNTKSRVYCSVVDACASKLVDGCLYSTECNDGMEWTGMTMHTERGLTTYTHCVCYLQPNKETLASSSKEDLRRVRKVKI